MRQQPLSLKQNQEFLIIDMSKDKQFKKIEDLCIGKIYYYKGSFSTKYLYVKISPNQIYVIVERINQSKFKLVAFLNGLYVCRAYFSGYENAICTFVDGHPHSINDSPAIQSNDIHRSNREWCQNGLRHRGQDKPAIIINANTNRTQKAWMMHDIEYRSYGHLFNIAPQSINAKIVARLSYKSKRAYNMALYEFINNCWAAPNVSARTH